MKIIKKTLCTLSVLALPWIITGCGGGSDDDGSTNAAQSAPATTPTTAPVTTPTTAPLTGTETDNINGVPVPPEPDATQNAATIAGVDVNANGIRDDVERVIAREFGGDAVKLAEAKTVATTTQALFNNPTQENENSYGRAIFCGGLNDDEISVIDKSILNTRDRLNKYKTILGGTSIGGDLCD